jgi:hypothetical protein
MCVSFAGATCLSLTGASAWWWRGRRCRVVALLWHDKVVASSCMLSCFLRRRRNFYRLPPVPYVTIRHHTSE